MPKNIQTLNTVNARKQSFCINRYNSTLFAYKDHAYHVFKPKQKSLSKSVVNTIISDYEIMLSHYSRVFVVRIELHPNTYSADNKVIKQFLKQLTTFLSGEYQSKVIYHCAREQDTSELEHYHLELMISAHKTNYSERILSLIKAMWEMHTSGTVAYVDNPFCIAYRGNKASLKQAVYRSSYFAKEHTKELNGKACGFLCNKLKPAKNFDPTTDLMLVDPDITFMKNRRKQGFEIAQAAKPEPSAQIGKLKKYGWFTTLSHAQQLKECIASRTTNLNHLAHSTPVKSRRKYRYKDSMIHQLTQVQITQVAPYEPKGNHDPLIEYDPRIDKSSVELKQAKASANKEITG